MRGAFIGMADATVVAVALEPMSRHFNVSLASSGMSTVTITYKYIPSNNLKPGNYTVIQTVQPTGFTDGKISSGGVLISHQPNVDVIPITLDGTNNSANNDFGKLVPAGISGYSVLRVPIFAS